MANLFPTGGVDYNTTSADLTFNSGTSRACALIPITDDLFDEDNEMFDITLTTAVDGISLVPGQGTVTIVDNDGRCSTTTNNLITFLSENVLDHIFIVGSFQGKNTSITMGRLLTKKCIT